LFNKLLQTKNAPSPDAKTNPIKANFKPTVSSGGRCLTLAFSIMSTTSLKHLTQSELRIKLMAKIVNKGLCK